MKIPARLEPFADALREGECFIDVNGVHESHRFQIALHETTMTWESFPDGFNVSGRHALGEEILPDAHAREFKALVETALEEPMKPGPFGQHVLSILRRTEGQLTYRQMDVLGGPHPPTLAAFMCDSSRVAVVGTNKEFVDGMDSAGGFHEVAHAANGLGGDLGRLMRLGGLMRDNNVGFFRQGFLDLVSKLDALSEGSGTMLDNSLVWWAHEAGASTHQGDSIPVLSAGSVGGAMHTGRYFDLRERGESPFSGDRSRFSNSGRTRGACLFQWTTSYLDAFGIPRSEWQQEGGRRAFSGMSPNPNWNNLRYDQNAMDASCDAPLPGLLV